MENLVREGFDPQVGLCDGGSTQGSCAFEGVWYISGLPSMPPMLVMGPSRVFPLCRVRNSKGL